MAVAWESIVPTVVKAGLLPRPTFGAGNWKCVLERNGICNRWWYCGMTSALEMVNVCRVVLAERREIGGRAATYRCKATDECNRCAACLVLSKEKVLQDPVRVYTMPVNEISKNGDGYKATVVSGEKELSLNVQAVILATGFDPYDLSRRNEFAFGREQNVVTGLELEKAIKEKGSITAAYGENIKKIGFIQCVGSRDLSIDNGYCSRVCCMYAAKLAKIIKNELPDTEVDIFYVFSELW